MKLDFDWRVEDGQFWVTMSLGDAELGKIRYDEPVDVNRDNDGNTTPEEAIIETVRTLFFGQPERKDGDRNRKFVRSE